MLQIIIICIYIYNIYDMYNMYMALRILNDDYHCDNYRLWSSIDV